MNANEKQQNASRWTLSDRITPAGDLGGIFNTGTTAVATTAAAAATTTKTKTAAAATTTKAAAAVRGETAAAVATTRTNIRNEKISITITTHFSPSRRVRFPQVRSEEPESFETPSTRALQPGEAAASTPAPGAQPKK